MLPKCCFFLVILVYFIAVVVYIIRQPGTNPQQLSAAAAAATSTMNAFLRNAKQLRSLEEPLLLILGNESCDLDSAISALSLAYFYAHAPTNVSPALRNTSADRIVPVLNVARRLLATKTEVTFYLRQQGVELESVVCRDELSDALIERAHFVLVDHHASPHAARALQIIDHRPLDARAAAAFPSNCAQRIETVGSCCTLIGDMILSDSTATGVKADHHHRELLAFLYPVIVLDTVNFSPQADRTTQLDRDVCAQIESLDLVGRSAADRQAMFDELVHARSDVSALNAQQLLCKDMKLVHGAEGVLGRWHVALPGFPIGLREFARLPNARESVGWLAREHDCAVVVLMSMVVAPDTGEVRRELAVVRTVETDEAKRLAESVMRALRAPVAGLDLVELVEAGQRLESLDGVFFVQGNVRASRKQVLPIVQRVVNECDVGV